jgi:putative endopeptidase
MKNKYFKAFMGFLFLGTLFFSCKTTKEIAQTETPIGINTSLMDTSVKASDDFFRFVNGKWIDNTEIPADRTRWGSFDELRKNTDEDVMAILKEAINDESIDPKSDQAKAINLYKSILDTVTRNKQGIEPLKDYLTKIEAVNSAADLASLLAEMEKEGSSLGFFGTYVGTDAKNSSRNVVYVGTGSLGLPDRDYYVSDAPDNVEKRSKYTLHVARMLQFIGANETQASKSAAAILALETKMSTATFDRVERRDRRKTYNPMTISELEKIVPTVNWDSYFKEIGIGSLDSVIVSQPKYLETLQMVFNENKVDD